MPNFIYAPFDIKSISKFNWPKKPANGGNPINENILINSIPVEYALVWDRPDNEVTDDRYSPWLLKLYNTRYIPFRAIMYISKYINAEKYISWRLNDIMIKIIPKWYIDALANILCKFILEFAPTAPKNNDIKPNVRYTGENIEIYSDSIVIFSLKNTPQKAIGATRAK